MGDRQHIPMLCYFMPLAFQHIVYQLFAQRAEMQAVRNKARLNTDANPLKIKVAIEFVIRFTLSELGGKFDIACLMVL